MESALGYRRSWRLKIFLFLALTPIYRSDTILATSVESHLGNIRVNFESHGLMGLGEDCIFKANNLDFLYFFHRSNCGYLGREAPQQHSYRI